MRNITLVLDDDGYFATIIDTRKDKKNPSRHRSYHNVTRASANRVVKVMNDLASLDNAYMKSRAYYHKEHDTDVMAVDLWMH